MSLPDTSRDAPCYERRWLEYQPPTQRGQRGVDVFDIYHFGHPRYRVYVIRGDRSAIPRTVDHPDFNPSNLWVVAFILSLWFF
jgi:hypothetical protein